MGIPSEAVHKLWERIHGQVALFRFIFLCENNSGNDRFAWHCFVRDA